MILILLNKGLQFSKKLKATKILNQSSGQQVQQEIKERGEVEQESLVQEEIKEK